MDVECRGLCLIRLARKETPENCGLLYCGHGPGEKSRYWRKRAAMDG